MRAPALRRAAPWTLATALAVLATVAVGCGGGDDPAVAPSPTGTATVDAQDGGGAPGEDAGVAVRGFRFAPDSLAVAAGAEVTWTNGDGTRHTVTPGRPEAPSEDFPPVELEGTGSTGTVPFARPGTYPYFCSVHPSMTGEVVVR